MEKLKSLRMGPNWKCKLRYVTPLGNLFYSPFEKVLLINFPNGCIISLKVLNKNYCFVCNALNYSLKYYYHVCYKKRKSCTTLVKKPTKKLRMMPFPLFAFSPELMKKCVHTKGQLKSQKEILASSNLPKKRTKFFEGFLP